MFKIIKKADVVLFFILLVFGITLSVLSFSTAETGKNAQISVDGKLYGTYSLSKDQVIEIKQKDSINKITIKDGHVQMSYSSCKNQVCVHDGIISKTNQSIVCLPNRIMIQIVGGEEEFDAVTN